MPKIAIYKYFTLFFYMGDTVGEPPHIHIIKNKGYTGGIAKYWLERGEYAETGELTVKEQTELAKLVEKNKAALIDAWKKAKSGQRVKTLNFK